MRIESIKNYIDGIKNMNGPMKVTLKTSIKGCNLFNKGRGLNTFKKKFDIDLDKVIKDSTYEVKIGASYDDMKKISGDECKRKTDRPVKIMNWLAGYEKYLKVNENGEVYLRCYIDKDTKGKKTKYILENGTEFDTHDKKYAEFKKEYKPNGYAFNVLNVKLENIVDIE